MKRLFFLLAPLAPWTAVLAADPVKTPAVNPAFAAVEEIAGLPRVLLLGDSISMGYTLPVREILKGKANVVRPPVNCSSTGNALHHLDDWLGKGKWDVVHFNFGLHDAKLPPEGVRHSPPELYEKNLRELVKRLKTSGAKLIWATTTPVPNGGVISPTRRFGDIDQYNAIARRVMEENGVSINDLNQAIAPQVAALQNTNDVHFSGEGSALLARAVATSVEKALAETGAEKVDQAAINPSGQPVRVALPAPEESRFAHLSWNKVVRTAAGTIILACVAGEFHGYHGGGSPAVSRSLDGGASFSPPEILREFGPGLDYTCCGNLALGVAEDGAIVLLAMAYTGDEANHIFGWRSEDDGLTWTLTDTRTLGPNKTGSVFGNIFPVDGQGLVVFGHFRNGSAPLSRGIWMAGSSDHGRSWGEPRCLSEVYAVEPVVIRSRDKLIGFFRGAKNASSDGNTTEGRQYVGVSKDHGQTWETSLSVLDARDPASARLAAPCAVEHPERPGEILVLTTERPLGKASAGRIWLWRGTADSLDWKRERVILEFPAVGKNDLNNDFGYPWLLHLEGDRWLLFYYHGQKKGPSPIWVTQVDLS